jgi:hypothetical protein
LGLTFRVNIFSLLKPRRSSDKTDSAGAWSFGGPVFWLVALCAFIGYLVPPHESFPAYSWWEYAISLSKTIAVFLAVVALTSALASLAKSERRLFCLNFGLLPVLILEIVDIGLGWMYRKNLVDVVSSLYRAEDAPSLLIDALARSGVSASILTAGVLSVGVVAAIGISVFRLLPSIQLPQRERPLRVTLLVTGIAALFVAVALERWIPGHMHPYASLMGFSPTHASTFLLGDDRAPRLVLGPAREPAVSRGAYSGPRRQPGEHLPRHILVLILEGVGATQFEAKTMPFVYEFSQTHQRVDAISSSSVSSKSVFSLLTGHSAIIRDHYDVTGTTGNQHLLRRLKNLGYKLALIGDSSMRHILTPLDGVANPIFDVYLDGEGTGESRGGRKAVYDAAKALLLGTDPFVIFLFPQTTHFPYDPADDCQSPSAGQAGLSLAALRQRYRCALRRLDGEFRDLVTSIPSGQLKQMDLYLLGDHGEEFGEEGYVLHAGGLTNIQLRVPLVYAARQSLIRPGATMSVQLLLPSILCSLGDCRERDAELLGRCYPESAYVIASASGVLTTSCRVFYGTQSQECYYAFDKARDLTEIRFIASVPSPADLAQIANCASFERFQIRTMQR